jgi:protein-S-isoprenylcysteine O-methyltransferase Ste14
MFKASSFEYRYRYLLHLAVYCLAFGAPWTYLWSRVGLQTDNPSANPHFWGFLAATLSRAGVGGSRGGSYELVLAFAIFFAIAGAILRTWGSAYLGSDVVQSGSMHPAQTPSGNGILEDGPFRYVRNPLYLGTVLHTLALSILMPLSGAIFAIVGIGALQIRLILAEEAFLSQHLGLGYANYCALVPRILPSLRPRMAGHGVVPRWGQAFVGQIYFWGVAVTLSVAGWSYNTFPLLQGVVISLGLSLVLRAVMPKQSVPA